MKLYFFPTLIPSLFLVPFAIYFSFSFMAWPHLWNLIFEKFSCQGLHSSGKIPWFFLIDLWYLILWCTIKAHFDSENKRLHSIWTWILKLQQAKIELLVLLTALALYLMWASFQGGGQLQFTPVTVARAPASHKARHRMLRGCWVAWRNRTSSFLPGSYNHLGVFFNLLNHFLFYIGV